jgi:hypothetical protein
VILDAKKNQAINGIIDIHKGRGGIYMNLIETILISVIGIMAAIGIRVNLE